MAATILSTAFRTARPSRACEPATFLRICRSRAVQTHSSHPSPISCQQAIQQPSARFLSSSRPFCATVAAQNPRQDEDGNEMTITISERAAKRLMKITSSQPQRNTLTSSSSAATSQSDAHLRVTVTSGGCHGFQYLMSLEPSDKIDAEEDTVFVAESGEDTGKGIAKVVLDESSLELLKGSTVDFTTELIGSQFKIVGNPRATSSCGCGTSFDIE